MHLEVWPLIITNHSSDNKKVDNFYLVKINSSSALSIFLRLTKYYILYSYYRYIYYKALLYVKNLSQIRIIFYEVNKSQEFIEIISSIRILLY